MIEINFQCLLLIFGVSGLILCICWRRTVTGIEKLFLSGTVAGLLLHCGIGAALEPVHWDYVACYCVFLATYGLSFVWILGKTRRMSFRHPDAYRRIEVFAKDSGLRWLALVAYCVCCLVPLLYPQFRLSLLWNPPLPDVTKVANFGLPLEELPLLRLNRYALQMVWPFYLIALYAFRKRLIVLALCTIGPVYCAYCSAGYVGRGDFLVCGLFFAGMIWFHRPQFRGRLVVLSGVALLIALPLFESYGRLRAGDQPATSESASERIQSVLLVEAAFPRSWERVVSSGRNADLGEYFKWMLTLPIPKLLTGDISGARINFELNEIVSGVAAGSQNFYVVLTGPVSESVYIYGPAFFWVHAAFIGVLSGLLCMLVGRSRVLLAVGVQLALLIAYGFSRGGVAAVLPTIANGYLSLWMLLVVLLLRSRRVAGGWGVRSRPALALRPKTEASFGPGLAAFRGVVTMPAKGLGCSGFSEDARDAHGTAAVG
jgi:hypothetical protein